MGYPVVKLFFAGLLAAPLSTLAIEGVWWPFALTGIVAGGLLFWGFDDLRRMRRRRPFASFGHGD